MLVVVMSDTAAGSSVHVSEENVYWVQRAEIEVVPLVLCWISSAYHALDWKPVFIPKVVYVSTALS